MRLRLSAADTLIDYCFFVKWYIIKEYRINISQPYPPDYTNEDTLMKTKILAVLMVLVMVASVFTVAAGDSSSSGLDVKTGAGGGV